MIEQSKTTKLLRVGLRVRGDSDSEHGAGDAPQLENSTQLQVELELEESLWVSTVTQALAIIMSASGDAIILVMVVMTGTIELEVIMSGSERSRLSGPCLVAHWHQRHDRDPHQQCQCCIRPSHGHCHGGAQGWPVAGGEGAPRRPCLLPRTDTTRNANHIGKQHPPHTYTRTHAQVHTRAMQCQTKAVRTSFRKTVPHTNCHDSPTRTGCLIGDESHNGVTSTCQSTGSGTCGHAGEGTRWAH
jgi:hypothetical protein